MTTKYASHLTNRRITPQSEQVPGTVQNNAGGYVYEVDKWQRLTRFLYLGWDGGTYYVKEKKLTRDNAAVIDACLAEDASRTIVEICNVSHTGRAPKNDQAVFALAIAASSSNVQTHQLAYGALNTVCRIPTHLFQFLDACKVMRGWSRGLRNAVGNWYAAFTPEKLAYELVKYQQREGWSNRDVLRLAHPSPRSAHQAAFRWAIGAPRIERIVENSKGNTRVYDPVGELPAIIAAFEEAKTASTPRLCALIREHGPTREMVPTEKLNEITVWAALLEEMPATALIRNLGKMTSIGLLDSMNTVTAAAMLRLTNQDYLRKSRVHPMAVLLAMKQYAAGHGDKGKLTWEPVRKVLDALDAAFYLSFGNVTPTNQKLMLALDISGSMSSTIGGTNLSCREACAAMALITMNVEPNCVVMGFTSASGVPQTWQTHHVNDGIRELSISPRQRLDDVASYMRSLTFGGTDCSLPMVHATNQRMDVDAFIVYTDDETWAGNIHPQQALKRYRDVMSSPRAAEVVVGMTATEFTIADPADPRTLDVVGFDAATPQAIATWLTS